MCSSIYLGLAYSTREIKRKVFLLGDNCKCGEAYLSKSIYNIIDLAFIHSNIVISKYICVYI